MIPPLPHALREFVDTSAAARKAHSGASGPFWVEPRGVVRPHRAEQVAELVAWASANAVPLIPRGAATGMPGGNVGPHLILDLSGLEGTVSADAEALTVTGPASATAAGMREAAAKVGLSLPALPSSARWCTAGGMVACNAAGARSLRFGSAAQWLREARWVNHDGSSGHATRYSATMATPGTTPGTIPDTILDTTADPAPSAPRARATGPGGEIHANLVTRFAESLPWPAIAKNSSGYALDRWLPSGHPLDLLAGSEGTLAVVTEVTFDLVPPDAVTRVMVLGLPDLTALVEGSRLATQLSATSCEYFGRALVELGGLGDDPRLTRLRSAGGMLLVELGGSVDQVESMCSALRQWASDGGGFVEADSAEERNALWALRHEASPRIMRAVGTGLRSIQCIEDCVVPPRALGAYVGGVERILSDARMPAVIFGHASQGNLHVNPLIDPDREGWRGQVDDVLEQTVSLVADLGGTLAGEHGDGRLRAPWLHRFFTPDVMDAFRAIKASCDPAGVLNPGVVLPEVGTDPMAGLGRAPQFSLGSQGPEAGHR